MAIIDNKGGLVTGPAGTGKSVILKQLRAHLKGEKVFTCAYTHAAARLTGGMTVARLLHFDTRLHDAWILIDEISLLPINTLGMLARLLLVGVKFVCFGDFDGQFEAMQDRWDIPYSEVQGSECLRDMCRSLHAHLKTNWRSKDSPELFDFYTGLYDTDDDLAISVQKAQTQFPVRLNAIDIDIVLCISHANRMIINNRQNEAKAMQHEANGGATVHVDWSGDDIKGTTCQPQPMLLWVGIELIGCPRGCGKDRYGIVQGWYIL